MRYGLSGKSYYARPKLVLQAGLPSGIELGAFLLASLVLAITPGPGVLFIVARSLGQGRRFGLASVAGVALGNFVNASAAGIGLAVVFASRPLIFDIVRYAGAAYLIYLGLRALVATAAGPDQAASVQRTPGQLFRDGFWVAALNPKTTLFFAAFLPQFVGAGPHSASRNLVLGGIFVGIAAITDTGYALAAGRIAALLASANTPFAYGRWLVVAVFFGLGIMTAVSGHR